MKHFLFAAVCAAMLVCTSPASAARTLDLTGNSYHAYIICNEDLGEFCDQGSMDTDTFTFDEGHFSIDSFDVFTGEYSSGAFSFDASGTAYTTNTDKYEFDLKGIRILDTILIGSMDIIVTELLGLGNSTSGKAFFLAFRK